MSDCSKEEVQCLFEDIEQAITGGQWKMRTKPKAWCSNFAFAIQDIQQYLFKFLMESQFSNFFGQNVETLDICRALTTQTMNQQLLLADFYSREVGLAGRTGDSFGQYEMKKGSIDLIKGQSFYQIPPNRQLMDVMWITQPSFVDAAVWSNLWGGFANQGLGGAVMGNAAGFWGGSNSMGVFPIYDTILKMQNFSMKDKMLNSELLYKVRAGANGTKIIELLSIPMGEEWNRMRTKYQGCKLWYTYYDTTDMSDIEIKECLDKCRNIIKYPSEMPLTEIEYCDFNPLFKIFIRDAMLVRMYDTEARIIGRFGGAVPVPNGVNLEINYSMLLDQASDIRDNMRSELKEFMDNLLPHNQSERKRQEVENNKVILSSKPDGIWMI